MFVDTWIHGLDSCYICLLWCTKFCDTNDGHENCTLMSVLRTCFLFDLLSYPADVLFKGFLAAEKLGPISTPWHYLIVIMMCTRYNIILCDKVCQWLMAGQGTTVYCWK
jgi:hypothetical protein